MVMWDDIADREMATVSRELICTFVFESQGAKKNDETVLDDNQQRPSRNHRSLNIWPAKGDPEIIVHFGSGLGSGHVHC